MVQQEASTSEIILTERKMSVDSSASKQFSDSVCLTKAPDFNNPTRYYRSTYDFSAPMRFKTVVMLEPALAPVR